MQMGCRLGIDAAIYLIYFVNLSIGVLLGQTSLVNTLVTVFDEVPEEFVFLG